MKYGNRGIGYNRRGYKWSKSVKSFKKTGVFKVVKNGSGHDAGYKWGNAKDIDPESRVRRYGKNSPSFDEGVYLSKRDRKKPQEVESKLQTMAKKM